MENKYTQLFRDDNTYWIEGGPLFIEARALTKNNQDGTVFGQCKFRNLMEKEVTAVYFDVLAFAPDGEELEPLKDQIMLDLKVPCRGLFGDKNPIVFLNNYTRAFSIQLKKVLFADGTIYTNTENTQFHLFDKKDIKPIEEFGELRKQYFRDCAKAFGTEAAVKQKVIPVIADDYIVCGCGAILYPGTVKCPACGAEISQFSNLTDVERLQDNLMRNRRNKKIAAAIVAIVLVIAALIPTVIMPTIDDYKVYREATALLESGDYDGAITLFSSLEGFWNSVEKVAEAKYRIAERYVSNQQYKEAINALNQLGDYADSSNRAAEIKDDYYQMCLSCVEKDDPSKEDYDAALEGFAYLADYKDSKELYISTSYLYACSLLDAGDYKEAVVNFNHCKGYKDADQRKIDATYNYGCQLIDQEEYLEAINQFNQCGDYADVETKIYEAKYGYVMTHRSTIDESTFKYINELIGIGYPGAEDLYNEIYAWTVSIVINDNESDSTTSKISINRNSMFYCHVKLQGGPPNGTVQLTYGVRYPNGQYAEDSWNEICRAGEVGSFYGDLDGVGTGTLTAYVYNKATGEKLGEASINVTGSTQYYEPDTNYSDGYQLIECITEGSNINIRNAPSTSGRIVGQFEPGMKAFAYEMRIAEGYTWYRIGNEQWVADHNGEWIRIVG